MEAREREKLVTIIGHEDAAAVERFLGGCALCTLVEAADGVDSDWPEWARAAAVLQRWLEAAGRSADTERKLGYLHCTVEAQKAVPTALRPALPQAVARMLKEHGFA
ncbi:hypothetical protein LBMAG55_05280 [Verrucomicrobiota bacterium]|nr:hypothetical protein EMGBD4_12630 [Verrucomicrobiota bacterium]GDY17205.1 hypothetical protein LBMAG55_05280 [Verrucomicrobiota bacterium]